MADFAAAGFVLALVSAVALARFGEAGSREARPRSAPEPKIPTRYRPQPRYPQAHEAMRQAEPWHEAERRHRAEPRWQAEPQWQAEPEWQAERQQQAEPWHRAGAQQWVDPEYEALYTPWRPSWADQPERPTRRNNG